jgi:hypothetical protein
VLVTTATTNDALHAAKIGHTARWGSTTRFTIDLYNMFPFLNQNSRVQQYDYKILLLNIFRLFP